MLNKLKHYVNVLKLIVLFKKSKKEKNYFKHFDYLHGANAFVLLPKNRHLSNYCLKCPMEQVILDDIILNNKIPEFSIFFETMKKKRGNVDNDVVMYDKIRKNKELKKHIPTFYFPFIFKKGKEIEFIIMEYVDGPKVELINLSQTSNDYEKELVKVYHLFLKHGYEFIDSVEGKYDKHKQKMVLIDLAGLHKND